VEKKRRKNFRPINLASLKKSSDQGKKKMPVRKNPGGNKGPKPLSLKVFDKKVPGYHRKEVEKGLERHPTA